MMTIIVKDLNNLPWFSYDYVDKTWSTICSILDRSYPGFSAIVVDMSITDLIQYYRSGANQS